MAGALLSDEDEINPLSGALPRVTIDQAARVRSPAIPRGALWPCSASNSKSRPPKRRCARTSRQLRSPDGVTVDLIQIAGQEVPCDPVTSGAVRCKLPSGTSLTAIDVSVTPTVAAIGSELTLGARINAPNAPITTASVTDAARAGAVATLHS